MSQSSVCYTGIVEEGRPATVAIVRAEDYRPETLLPAMERALSLIGGLDGIVARGAKVFVKINHLPPPSPPERGIVTHPAFTAAFLQLLKATGADITVGDDIDAGEDGFVVSGYREMCKRMGVKLVNLRESGFVPVNCDGACLHEVYISRVVAEADVIINLPKLKTHSLTTMTGGVKNLYGVIPIGLRRRYHGEFLNVADFARMLVDIFATARPQLTIMDAVDAMEGEGPGSGKMRHVGVILASRDAVALDAVAGKIIGLEPARVLTTTHAAARGLGEADLSRIQIAGGTIAAVAVRDFKLPATIAVNVTRRAPRFLGRLVIAQITPRPSVRKKDCTACGKCAAACPTGAATVPDGTARIDYALCIRCMCCHEVCRFGAVVPRRPQPGQMVYGVVDGVRKVGKRQSGRFAFRSHVH